MPFKVHHNSVQHWAIRAVWAVATGIPLADLMRASDISSGDPKVIANMVFVRPELCRYRAVGEISYEGMQYRRDIGK